MAKKPATLFICQSCGSQFPKWQGRCFECGKYGSLVETVMRPVGAGQRGRPVSGSTHRPAPARLGQVQTAHLLRLTSAISEFDRVLGGGLVPGSVLLIGGEPGIGKSTLLLQIAASAGMTRRSSTHSFANASAQSPTASELGSALRSAQGSRSVVRETPPASPGSVFYISGEESPSQIKHRYDRLGLKSDRIFILAETDVDIITAIIDNPVGAGQRARPTNGSTHRSTPTLIIIDSIQTLSTSDLSSAAGSISQVQECTRRLISVVKSKNIPLILVGHVTKQGNLAGPKTLEHLVDVVLYLEGERFSDYRVLRGVKNRFGGVGEAGIFRMADRGLEEVRNPSREILADHQADLPGSCLTVTIQGQRPLLLEIQALTTPAVYGVPKRVANGIDYNRLLMLLAVLQKRAGLNFASQDVFVNVSGGFKISEPAVDLAVCLALGASVKNKPLISGLCALGEVGLLGEVKAVNQQEKRIKEAKKMGFDKVLSKDRVKSVKEAVVEAIV